jgi:HAD superfamily hydrolase (TIGR01509 family)
MVDILKNMKAVIFDMDGVISDTQVLHAHNESELLKEYGIDMRPEEISRRYAGVPDEVQFPEIFKEAGKELLDLSGFIRRKWDNMFDFPTEDIRPIPGALELIDLLYEKKIPLAVASGSPMNFIEHVLGSLNRREKFSVLVSGDEVTNGKPAPDIFLLAAKRLGVAPEECVVIEDGLSGMQGAKAAGMKCVALLTNVRSEESPADIKVTDLQELSIENLIA